MAAVRAGLSQPHQPSREPSIYTIKQLVHASLNSKLSIAREEPMRIKKNTAVSLEIMAAQAAG